MKDNSQKTRHIERFSAKSLVRAILSIMIFGILLQGVQAIAISSCTKISSGGMYELTTDISNSTGNCIDINASNVEIDGQGNSVSSYSGVAIFSEHDNDFIRLVNVTLRNFIIKDSSNGAKEGGGFNTNNCPEVSMFNITVFNISSVGLFPCKSNWADQVTFRDITIFDSNIGFRSGGPLFVTGSIMNIININIYNTTSAMELNRHDVNLINSTLNGTFKSLSYDNLGLGDGLIQNNIFISPDTLTFDDVDLYIDSNSFLIGDNYSISLRGANNPTVNINNTNIWSSLNNNEILIFTDLGINFNNISDLDVNFSTTSSEISRFWFFDLRTILLNNNDNPISNANVSIFNSTGFLVNNQLTNSSGSISRLLLLGDIFNSTGTTFTSDPHVVNITKIGYFDNSTTYDINSSRQIFAVVSLSGFTEDSQSFNVNVSETEQQTFSINISYDSRYDFISADLLYNGTRRTGTLTGSGDNVTFNVIFDLPLVQTSVESEIRNLTWEVSLIEGTTTTRFNSTTQSQNVSRTHLEICDATFTVQALNFTAYDEVDSSRINPFYFAGDFDFWLGTGTVKRDNVFFNTSADEINLCISPVDRNFTIDATIEYNDFQNGTTFNTRNYFFQGDLINNQSQDIFLFLLNVDDSTSFILKVQDTNLLPVADALIIIQRFDPGTGNFTTVSIAKTDDNGLTVGFFKTETVDYRFIIRKNGVVLLTTGSQKVVPETAPFTLTFTVGADEGAPWIRFEDLPNVTTTLTFDPDTGNVTFTYVDVSGQFTLGRLVLTRQNLSGFSTEVCNVNSTSSSSTLICGTSNITGTYIASAFITRDSDIFLVEQIVFNVETFATIVGLLGVFLAWFIILVSAFAFKFNEIAGIVLMNITVIMVNIIGLVNFGYLYIFGMMGVSILIIVLLER